MSDKCCMDCKWFKEATWLDLQNGAIRFQCHHPVVARVAALAMSANSNKAYGDTNLMRLSICSLDGVLWEKRDDQTKTG